MKKVFIYILIDPRKPGLVRYVGQTETPKTRHVQHCAESGRSAKAEWLESMRQEGVMPQMIIVAETSPELADSDEIIWISRFTNCRLLSNTTHNPIAKLAPKVVPLPIITDDKPAILNTLQSTERAAIVAMLKACAGNKKHAANRLGIGRQTLYNKIAAYEIQIDGAA
jgi:DNA-binding NtrC family response regulator